MKPAFLCLSDWVFCMSVYTQPMQRLLTWASCPKAAYRYHSYINLGFFFFSLYLTELAQIVFSILIQSSNCRRKEINWICFSAFIDMNSNFALNLGYLKPAFNNPAMAVNFFRSTRLYIFLIPYIQCKSFCLHIYKLLVDSTKPQLIKECSAFKQLPLVDQYYSR